MAMRNSIFQKFSVLQRSVSALMDDPLKEHESSANYYLTMHCLMLVFFLLSFINKHIFDVFHFLKEVWPIKSTNFRNPLSVDAVVTMVLGVPIFLFWRWVGKNNPLSDYKSLAMRNYMWVTIASSIAVNFALLFIAAQLRFPELSLILGVLNFFLWARWSVRKYAEFAKTGGGFGGSA